MDSDIARYVRHCEICKAQKPEQKLPYGVMHKRNISRPWEVICTDLMGPFPLSKKKNRFILVVSDLFTKYTLLFPIKSATSQAVTEHLEKDVFMIYGVPERVICDNGRQYISNQFRTMVSSYQCKLCFNAYYHAQANPTERVNRVIKTMIRSYVDRDHRTWDEHLHQLGFALRTAVHEVTGFSPVFLNFGREVYLSGKVHNKFGSENPAIDFEGRQKWASHILDLKNRCADVKLRLEKAYQQSAHRYNLRRRELSPLAVGQVVWKRNYTLSEAGNYFASKLAPKYLKCRVQEKISPNVYRLTDFKTGKTLGNWHIQDLKLDSKGHD